jgi:hypothetical protein
VIDVIAKVNKVDKSLLKSCFTVKYPNIAAKYLL